MTNLEFAFDDFSKFLISKHIVTESKVTYYVHWVLKCLRYARKTFGDDLTPTETEQFLKSLSKSKEEWQVDQATLAIKVYQYFIKTRKAPVHHSTADDKQQ